MNRLQLEQRVRTLTRDLTNSIFRQSDILDFINEGLDRVRQVIPEMSGLEYLMTNTAIPTLIPVQYRVLLALYATSRCFAQDERHYQATTYMNEFENKLDEFKTAIENGDIIIKDADGNVVTRDNNIDYVDTTVYYGKHYKDIDYGVEGVE